MFNYCYECLSDHFGICDYCCNEYNICLECVYLEHLCEYCEYQDEAIFIDDTQIILEWIVENYNYFNDITIYEEDYDY